VFRSAADNRKGLQPAIRALRARAHTHQVGVGDVGPGGDAVDAAAVLAHHRVADVRKLAVLEDQEVCTEEETSDLC
jgi:hypothetical protein